MSTQGDKERERVRDHFLVGEGNARGSHTLSVLIRHHLAPAILCGEKERERERKGRDRQREGEREEEEVSG